MMHLRAQATINLSSLQHNLHQVKKFAPNAHIMAMVKANAYGHGAPRIAATLQEADAFGVATIDEAITLRQSGITKPITVMSGFINADELHLMLAQNLTAVIHHFDQISRLQNIRLPSPLSIWLKIDTGMHRLGFLPPQVTSAYTQLSNNPNIKKPIGLMTHLASSDKPDNPHSIAQIALFEKTVIWEGPRSIAGSAAIIAWPQTHANWVRPGIMLYGVSPFEQTSAFTLGLKPVMSLSARLMTIKALKKGDTVGYNTTWVCPEDKKIGIVSIGYGDGYPRQVKNGTPVLVNGKRCALVGRVSMDLISIDLSNEPDAAVGDSVLLWGEGLPIEEIAQSAGTSGYELLCKITARVPYIYST